MKVKKKIWHGLFVLLCLFILMLPAKASSIPAERQKPLLVDDAGLLTTEESTALLEKLEEISQRQQNEVAIVTVNSLDGKTAQAYADDYYDYNGYGYGENDDGILLLISMGERKWAISTYGYCHLTAFTDAGISYISNEFQRKLSSGKYAQAFDCFADLCDQFLTQAATGEPYDVGNMPSGHVAPFWLFVDILIGFLISFFMVRRKAGSLKSVVKQNSAKAYTREGSMTVRVASDQFVNRIVTEEVPLIPVLPDVHMEEAAVPSDRQPKISCFNNAKESECPIKRKECYPVSLFCCSFCWHISADS